jgi:hypothetical protein
MPVGVPTNASTGSPVTLGPGFDCARGAAAQPQAPYTNGTFDWPIPWLYSTDGGLSGHVFTIMDQVFTVSEAGTASVSKGGASGHNYHGDPDQDF